MAGPSTPMPAAPSAAPLRLPLPLPLPPRLPPPPMPAPASCTRLDLSRCRSRASRSSRARSSRSRLRLSRSRSRRATSLGSFMSNSATYRSARAMRMRMPISPIGVFTSITSSRTIRSAWSPARGSIPAVCFSNAERSPRSLPDTVICTPRAPASMTCCRVHIMALRNAVPLSRCEAMRPHITLGDSSGFTSSCTDTCGRCIP